MFIPQVYFLASHLKIFRFTENLQKEQRIPIYPVSSKVNIYITTE